MKKKFFVPKKTVIVGIVAVFMFCLNFKVNALVDGGEGGMGCYNPQTYSCPFGFTRQACNFTGVYGAPYNCQEWGCLSEYQERHCVQG